MPVALTEKRIVAFAGMLQTADKVLSTTDLKSAAEQRRHNPRLRVQAKATGTRRRHLIRANYSANADIVLARADEVLAIDESLLQFSDDKPYVEVETASQTFERREIEVGLSDGIKIEVVSGVAAEDRIKNPNSGQRS